MTYTEIACSLITESGVSQSVPPGSLYTVVRFPYVESSDTHDLHPVVQPDNGSTVTSTSSPRSGLIWPKHSAWAHLYALMYWEDGPYTEIRDRFVRDPMNLSTGYDSTCTEDHAKTAGGQYIAKAWAVKTYVGTPLSVMVRHNASVPVDLTLAEFKLIYRVDL